MSILLLCISFMRHSVLSVLFKEMVDLAYLSCLPSLAQVSMLHAQFFFFFL